MTPGTYTMPTFVRGDTWQGVDSMTITVNSAAPANSLSSVLTQFRRNRTATGEPLLELSSADASEIVIDDADNWVIQFPPQQLSLPAGTFYYDIQFTDSSGAVKTYVSGTIVVQPDVTR